MESYESNSRYVCGPSPTSWTAEFSLSGDMAASSHPDILGVRATEPPTNDCLLSALSTVIRKRRLSMSMSQQTLAEKVGLDRSYLISIEHAKRNPSVTTLAQIAGGLKISISELLNLAEQALDTGV